MAQMAEMLHSIVPGLSPLDVRSDACANCTTPTGLPYIGAVRVATHEGSCGLFVATGGNGLAAKSSDEIGRLAARAVLSPSGWADDEMHPLLQAERFQPRIRQR